MSDDPTRHPAPDEVAGPAPDASSARTGSEVAPPSSLPEKGRRPHPLSPIVQGWIGLVALLVFLSRDILEQGFDPAEWRGTRLWITLGVLGLIAVITLVTGFISWRYTRFVLDDQGLRIDVNFIEHSSNRVLYTKIQSVDIVQPFAARLIGLASVRVEAGGDAKKIQYLTKGDAEELRDDLMRRAVIAQQHAATPVDATAGSPRAQVAGEGPALESSTPVASTDDRGPSADEGAEVDARGGLPGSVRSPGTGPAALQEPTRLLVQVRPAQLILAAVTAPEFVVSAVTLVGLGVVPWIITGHLWSAGILVPAAFGLVSFVSSRVIKEWNYRLTESQSGTVRISRGLTTTVNQTVPHDRIQGFAISQSYLGRLVGLWRVQIEVLGYNDEEADDGGSTVLLPAGDWQQVLIALQAVWPGFDPLAIPMQGLPRRGRWLRPLTWKSHAWGMTDHVLVHRGGVIVHTISAVHHARVQSVRADQGPLQRRLGLASASAHITNGPVDLTIPDLDAAVASDIVRTELGRAKRALHGVTSSAGVTEFAQGTPARPDADADNGPLAAADGGLPDRHSPGEAPYGPHHDGP